MQQRWLCFVALLSIQQITPGIAKNGDFSEPIECPGGLCVEKYLCPSGTYDPKGAQNMGIITLRFGEDDDCLNYMKVCCPNVEIEEYATTDLQPMNDISSESASDTGNPGGFLYDLKANRSYAQFGEFPWMVAILSTFNHSNKPTYDYVGGGTLIHPRFVVSAAHVLENKQNLVASFGVWDMQREVKGYETQLIHIEQDPIVHPEYEKEGLWNDIALVMLKHEVIYRRHIRPIHLPIPTDRFDGKVCTSIGWGFDKRTNEYATVLKRVDLPVVPRRTCKEQFAATRLGIYFQLHKSVLCAGGEEGLDMCDGDGGSGLFCRNEQGASVLAGIVSWGLSCFQKDVPGAYVNVARFVPWINEEIQKRE